MTHQPSFFDDEPMPEEEATKNPEAHTLDQLNRCREVAKHLLRAWPYYTMSELWDVASAEVKKIFEEKKHLQGALMSLLRTGEAITDRERTCRCDGKKWPEWKAN